MEFRGLPQAPSAPVSFHVASLLESFSIIPSAAAPAILDCILASSSLSSSALFSSLLEAIPAVVQPPQSNYILSYMTSLCHLIGKTGSQYDSMSQFIWRVFLPLLKASPDESELLSQMDALFCEVVSKIQPWELMGVTLVPFCLRSLRFSLGIYESEDLATYQWKVDNIDQDYNSIPLGALPLQSGCRVLKSLLLSAMRCKEMLVLMQSSAEEEDILVCFINNLTWDLSRLVLGVHMQSSEHRSSAVRILLPVIIRCLNELSPVSVCVQGSLCRLSRVSFSKELWNCCSTLFGLGHLERLDALSILSIYFSIFFDNDKFDNQSIENAKLFVAIERKEFWEEIRKGLVDNDSAMRKQALYILKILLKHYSLLEIHDAGCFSGDSRMRLEDDKNNLDDIAMSVGATKRERWADREARSLGVGEVYHTMDQFLNSYGRWKVFILLYEMLEEYGTHLVEAAWSHQGSEFECVPISLMEKVMDFLNGVREDLRFSMAKDAMIIKNEHFDATNMWKDMAELPDGSSKEPQAMLKDINLDFQRKITLQKEVRPSIDHDSIAMASGVEFPRLLSDLEKEDQLFGSVLQVRNQALERIRQQKQQFILVASLIDRIPNLAGLARTCEIFKAAGLVIADASILQDKQFQLISVTAEKWVPIIEVPFSNIKGFLEKKRKEGFSILGLEQTANSTRLDQYSFPTKTVLVLGREKEGIPVDIIHVLDGCVEIPQLGIIRSLNVHVSGAIALWEYTRQQRHKL